MNGIQYRARRFRVFGEVIAIRGSAIECRIPGARIGDLVRIAGSRGAVHGRVSGFDEVSATVSPLDDPAPVRVHARVELLDKELTFDLPARFAGCVLDATGNFLGPEDRAEDRVRIAITPGPRKISERASTHERLVTGIRSIDSFVPIASGQRLMIAAEPGAGKTSLLRMLAEGCEADCVIFALIGERGREAAALIDGELSAEVRSRAILVVSTSDELPARRVLSAQLATSAAEYYAGQGKRVLLLFDSLTRYARAAREVALGAGELPVRRGYPASVFSELPKLLERPGRFRRGSITAFYTMLFTAELDEDPMIEEVRGILDGHIVLRRSTAESGLFPALSVPESLSRLEGVLTEDELRAKIALLRALLSRLANDRKVALFAEHIDPELATALALEQDLREFLRHSAPSTFPETARKLLALSGRAAELHARFAQEWRKNG